MKPLNITPVADPTPTLGPQNDAIFFFASLTLSNGNVADKLVDNRKRIYACV